MNILILNVDYQPQYIGGIKRVSITLAHQWQARGHNVYFITECPSAALCNDNIDGINQETLPPCKSRSEEKIQFIIDRIKRHNIDVLINPHIEERFISEVCFEVRRRTNVKLVSVLHFAPTTFIDEKNAYHNHPSIFMPKGYKALVLRMKWNLITKRKEYAATGKWFGYVTERSDKVVLLSDRFIPTWCKMAHVTTDKVTAISNPVTLSRREENPTLVDKRKLVLWCGRIGFGCKRTDYMLGIWKRVVRKHPDWQCVIMGSGDVSRWEAIVQKNEIPNIKFTGFCNPAYWYEQGCIFCLTSSTEGWGLVLIEAMNYGCAPMAYNSFDSLTDIINDGENGFVIPAFDEDLYVEKLEWLMDHADERERMQKNGLETVRKLSNSSIADKWLKLFVEI